MIPVAGGRYREMQGTIPGAVRLVVAASPGAVVWCYEGEASGSAHVNTLQMWLQMVHPDNTVRIPNPFGEVTLEGVDLTTTPELPAFDSDAADAEEVEAAGNIFGETIIAHPDLSQADADAIMAAIRSLPEE